MRRLFGLIVFTFLWSLPALGQGKIAGHIEDVDDGGELIGVAVVIDDDTGRGTTTDLEGNYVLLNLRPGLYTLDFSYIGYQTQLITDIQVTSGQTTRIDVKLRQSVIEGEELIVQAERPLVQKDLTASRETVVAAEIEALPVESFFGVLATTAGVTTGASGRVACPRWTQ